MKIERTGDCLVPVDRLAYQLEAVDGREQSCDAFTEISRVVRNKNPYRLGQTQLPRRRAVIAVSVLPIRGRHRGRHGINRALSMRR